MAEILDGKKTSAIIRNEIAKEISMLKENNIVPGLAVVLVGNNHASQIYVRNKKRACEEVGIYSETICLPETTTQNELQNFVAQLNNRKDIHGILVQLPLPQGLDEKAIVKTISPLKDVDAFHAENVGRIMMGDNRFLPCTPAGIIELLNRYNISVSGKECVVIGRSNIVGKPMAMLLLQNDATVTICHSKTRGLSEICARADILISAVGKSNFVKSNMVKPGAVVVDVGMNRNENGKLCGDVCFDEIAPVASYITPVPGGVGPMTIAMLLKNVLYAAKLQNGKSSDDI